MQPVIELKDVWKTYKIGDSDIHALRGLNFKVHKGEFVSIMGPSGSGKSTAMNMIGSLDIPTKGNVFLDGKDIAKFSESDLATLRGKKIGFVFQQFNLIPSLTAKENVMLPMIFQSVPPEEREKRATALLAKVNLQERMNNRASQLSGGQQQRVAIARSLANQPDLILADEPTGNLDSVTGKAVMEMLRQLHNEGATIVVVTHDENIAKHADRIEYLKDGKVLHSVKNN